MNSKHIIIKSISIAVLALLLYNCLALGAELIQLNDWNNYNILFKHGGFMVNDEAVGFQWADRDTKIWLVTLFLASFVYLKFRKGKASACA